MSIFGMALNSTWWWGSTFGSVEYSFIGIIVGLASYWVVVVHFRILSVSQIDLFKNESYSLGLCAKKLLKQLHKI